MISVSRWGAAVRNEWRLDPAIVYLNHGGFGVMPQAVLAEQDRWRARIERNPTHFLTFEIDDALRDAVKPVAGAIAAAPEDVVFVENATSGLNAVLRSLDFEPGDEILITSLSYPAIRKAAQYTASRSGARVVEAEIALPIADDAAILRAVAGKLGIRTKLAIFDHIASHSALVLPAAALTRLAHEAGATVMIDGAHAPGMIPLDVPAIAADWYVGNLHKWCFAPRSCGFLWATKAMQRVTHPLAISHGYGDGFRAEFDWTGTRDVTPALAAPAAIDFHTRLGGAALMTRNIALARAAATLLQQRWGTELTGPLDSFAAMATVRLPLADPPTGARATALMRELSERHGIVAAVVALADALWVRIAAQAYNDMADYERLAAVLAPHA
ncbi:MAG TPA: aminotransferase class V-fold PLP-dependent enzyme [Stellaceae bacterium]|nr:aminotransferase class V-fold PLP-dependent enzyme [Stellaceae bacterium]